MLARGELDTSDSNDHHAGHQHRDDALAAFGLVLEEPALAPADEVFYLWVEHLPALVLWDAVQTQWRHGFNGATGLDYAGVRASPAFARLRRRQREAVFADVCTMERATLAERQIMRAERGR